MEKICYTGIVPSVNKGPHDYAPQMSNSAVLPSLGVFGRTPIATSPAAKR